MKQSAGILDNKSLGNAWTDRFTGYECSVLSGTFTIGKAEDRLEQVELNTQIKQMERDLAEMVVKL